MQKIVKNEIAVIITRYFDSPFNNILQRDMERSIAEYLVNYFGLKGTDYLKIVGVSVEVKHASVNHVIVKGDNFFSSLLLEGVLFIPATNGATVYEDFRKKITWNDAIKNIEIDYKIKS